MKKNRVKAFPRQTYVSENGERMIQSGMELRDYFAAKAMLVCPYNNADSKHVANFSYELADEMLKARKL